MTTIVDGTTGITFPSTISGVSPTQQYSSRVLQVTTGTLSTQTTISSTSLVDIGLSASITPVSSSSKILIQVCVPWNTDRGSVIRLMGGLSVLRNSTAIWSHGNGLLGTEFGNTTSVSFRWVLNTMVYDSPATTSPTTYKVQASTELYPFTLCVTNTLATITLMEIAG